MIKIASKNVRMFPSQGRSDFFNRTARYVSEVNATIGARAVASKCAFVVSGLDISNNTINAGTCWMRGYVFSVDAIAISAIAPNPTQNDIVCFHIKTDKSGKDVGVADRLQDVINDNLSYVLDSNDGAQGSETSYFLGLCAEKMSQSEWNSVSIVKDSTGTCGEKVETGQQGIISAYHYYLKLAEYDGTKWIGTTSKANGGNQTVLNKTNIEVNAIAIAPDSNISNDTNPQDLGTFLKNNYVLDASSLQPTGNINTRIKIGTAEALNTRIITVGSFACVNRGQNKYLVVGSGAGINNTAPICARTIAGYADDEDSVYSANNTTNYPYKISGNTSEGLYIQYAQNMKFTIKSGEETVLSGPSKQWTTGGSNSDEEYFRINRGIKININNTSAATTQVININKGNNSLIKITADGNVVAAGKVSADSLKITNDIESASITVNGNAAITEKATIGNVEISKTLTVNDAVTFNKKLNVMGIATFANNLDVTGTITGKISVTPITDTTNIVTDGNTLATAFGIINNALNRIKNGQDGISFTERNDFGGTGRSVASIQDLLDVVEGVFNGSIKVEKLLTKSGFVAG